MKIEDKLKLLQNEIQQQINAFDMRQIRNRRIAMTFKIFSVMLASATTVLLGIQIEAGWAGVFKNIALVLSALLTVISAVEAFFDNRSLWIRQFVTLMRLHDLKRDVAYYVAGTTSEELDIAKLDNFKEHFDNIIQENIKEWIQIRGGTQPTTQRPSSVSS